MSGAGPPSRLGLTLEPGGARARIRSEAAERVWLCLFEGETGGEIARLPLERRPGGLWESRLEGMAAGQVYGLRAAGPWAPERGLLFDPAKLLIDPQARWVIGGTGWRHEMATAARGVDSAHVAPRAVLTDPEFDWRGDRPPGTPWDDTVIYEAHVKGLTARHPEVPPAERGTYLGLTHPALLEHLIGLGITAVQLMPVAHFLSERHLVESGLSNYWGYNPIAFYAPFSGYAATGRPVAEFKEMVRRLHAAGLEVILDVVLNHTAEGGAGGSTLCFKGLDNPHYYRLDPEEPSAYVDYTGCGNTLDFGRPQVVELAVDALRYWVEEMHVDGFRFDLAVTLGRGPSGLFEPHAPFFEALAAAPALALTKLIAEPWDLGPSGYQLGNFPRGWHELNDRFRDATRAYWCGDATMEPELRARLAGSPDLFPAADGRSAATVNYVTCHDGFTLEDLVSYDRKHNEANRENNHDGSPYDLSRNWGVEGPTRDGAIRARRRRAKRGMLAALALARGVPLILHGDELGRTQRGNNNAYCQDNEISWTDWEAASSADGLASLLRRLLRFRRRLHRRDRAAGSESPSAADA